MSGLSAQLPRGWAASTLGAIGEYHNGRGFKKHEWNETGRPIIRIQNLTDPSKPFNYYAGNDVDPRHEVRAGDLLVSWAATLDVFQWQGPDAVLNQHIFKVESYIDLEYHYYVLKYALAALYAQSHGSGMVHVTRGRFDETPVLVPPLKEQPRIVERMRTLTSRVAEGVAAHAEARKGVAVFEASLRHHMCWNGPASDESQWPARAAQHFAISREEAFYQRKAAGRSRGRYKDPLPPLDPPVALPMGWTTLSLDQVCEFVTDGDHNPPPRVPVGVPHLTAKNVVAGSLSFEDVTHISEQDWEKVRQRY